MENTATNSPSRRGKSLKFDQEWKDAVDRLPKHYRDEICAAIESYQRDLTVIEVTPGVPRAIFMLIMPTIRRRYRARELRRLARARKAAAKPAPSSRCISRQNNAPQPKPAQQAPNRQPKPQQSQVTPAVKQKAAADVKQQAPQPKSAPCEQPKTATSPPRQQPEAVPAKAHSRNYCATSTPVITARNTEQVLKPSASKKNSIFFGICCSFSYLLHHMYRNAKSTDEKIRKQRQSRLPTYSDGAKSTIYSVCYMYATSKEEADDLFQETLVNLWQGFDSFRGDSSIRSWVYRISLNTCLTQKRKKRIKTVPLDISPEVFSDTTPEGRNNVLLHQRITRLEPFDRAIILLWLEDMTYEEIAAIVGISVKALSVRLTRIRQKLISLNSNS